MEGGSFVNDATGPYAGVITGFTHHATFVNRESETAPEDPALSFLSAVELQAFKRFVKHFVATKESKGHLAMLDFISTSLISCLMQINNCSQSNLTKIQILYFLRQ